MELEAFDYMEEETKEAILNELKKYDNEGSLKSEENEDNYEENSNISTEKVLDYGITTSTMSNENSSKEPSFYKPSTKSTKITKKKYDYGMQKLNWIAIAFSIISFAFTFVPMFTYEEYSFYYKEFNVVLASPFNGLFGMCSLIQTELRVFCGFLYLCIVVFSLTSIPAAIKARRYNTLFVYVTVTGFLISLFYIIFAIMGFVLIKNANTSFSMSPTLYSYVYFIIPVIYTIYFVIRKKEK